MMREKVFRFKQFAVRNDQSAMKVGTDGVLLGAWCSVEGAAQVLDIGTGCGLIALMIAQRNSDARISAIDIDVQAVNEAQENFAQSRWCDRLKAWNCDFRSYAQDCSSQYNLIVSNPPFFNETLLSPNQARTQARHTCSLSFADLINGAANMLSREGHLCIITPASSEQEIRLLAAATALQIARVTFVHPVAGAPAKRILWDFVKSAEFVYCQEEQLIIELSRLCYSEQYTALTRNFYLKM